MPFARRATKSEQVRREVRVDRERQLLIGGHLVLWSGEEAARAEDEISIGSERKEAEPREDSHGRERLVPDAPAEMLGEVEMG